MKKPIVQIVVQLVFMIVAGVVSMLVAMGLEFHFDQLSSPEYWGRVLANLVASQIIYNTVFAMDQRNRRADRSGNYYRTLATNQIKLKIIEVEKRTDELDKAVKEENRERYEKACTSLLHTVTGRISFIDIDPDLVTKEYAADLAEKYKLTKRRARHLRKVLYRIARGRVRFNEITVEEILKDEELEKVGSVDVHVNYKWMAFKRNAIKVITFLIFSVLMASIGYSFQRPDFFAVFLTNMSLFVAAAASGIMQSYSHARFRAAVFEERNKFLSRRMNIMDEYRQKPGE